MLTKAKCLFLLSLLLLFFLWKEAQGACSSCPSNACSQSGLSEGKCYGPRYYRTTSKTVHYFTSYYQESSLTSYYYRCARWFLRRRCTGYYVKYIRRSESSLRYSTAYHNNLACDAYCCTGYRESSSGNCKIVSCGNFSDIRNGYANVESNLYQGTGRYECNSGYQISGANVRHCQSNGQWSGTPPQCIDIDECQSNSHACNATRTSACVNSIGDYICLCKTGYESADDGHSCEDIDECDANPCNPSTSTHCVNTDGDYRCNCKTGYQPSLNGHSCEDIDECDADPPVCDPARTTDCVNIDGDYRCRCKSGYHLSVSGHSCEDIDECDADPPVCDPAKATDCINTDGDYRCRCRSGYDLSADGHYCEDIDECHSNPHACNGTRTSGCVNSVGDYTCLCKNGYKTTDDGHSCEDVNECDANPCNPLTSTHCVNTDGDYKCNCKTGYQPSTNGHSCEDIDECDADPPVCDPARTTDCVNTDGDYRCRCKNGYDLSADGHYCEDIDECHSNPHACNGTRTSGCVNSVGDYSCLCKNGYKATDDGHSCEDVDECDANPCNPLTSTHCTNTDGDYRCYCKKGYQPSMDAHSCEDIDECDADPPVCDPARTTDCINTDGDYICRCKSGYHLSDDGHSCEDINECERNTHSCHPDRAHCLNKEGGFDCKCKNGYVLSDDEDCIDLNECETGQHNCNPRTSMCLNTIGSYKCHCLSGFALTESVNVANDRTCKDIDECGTTQAGNCEHRCGNLLGSYQCHCNEGYSVQDNKCKRDIPPCAKEQLPVPANGDVSCKQWPDALRCTLACQDMFAFGSSVDFSPQYCRDGVWDYQRYKQNFPSCQPIKKRVLEYKGRVESNETCLFRQKFKEIYGQDTPIPASIEAQCKRSGSRRKRLVADGGKIFLTFTFSAEIPFDCDFDCLDRISWTLRFQFLDIQWKIASGLALTMTDLETSEQLNVTLHEELQPETDDPQVTCTSGRILSQDQGFCIPCAVGSFFNTSGPAPRCDPCPFHYYQNESEQPECKACPSGTFTIAQGSTGLGDCKAPCTPGTASQTGLAPCKECMKGFYQPNSRANFCHKCDFGLKTHSSGSTRKEECGCPAGTYWNDCLEKCPCANGGICELDGSCRCPQGLTGPNCTKQDLFRACQDSYLISFWKNGANQEMRHIFALTGSNNGSVSVSVKLPHDSTPQVSGKHLSTESQFHLQLLPDDLTVAHISASKGISILGINEEEDSEDAFAALPISPLLQEVELEEYYVLSHANQYVQTDFKSVIRVITSTDNTQLKVTPAHKALTVEGGMSLEKDKELVIVRHRLNTLTLTSSDDLTGTVVRANKPIAVYSGHECGNVPVHISSCSYIVEQMPPVRVWGYCYIATSFMGRQDGSHVKFVVANDETYVDAYENGDLVLTYGPLNQGMFRERYLDPGRVLVLKSNQPILVAQFSLSAQEDEVGAPFMILLSSLSQLVSEVPFYSKNNSNVNYYHYITITVPTHYYDEDAIILDGDQIHSNTTFTVQSPDCGNFTMISLEVEPGRHYLQHTTPGAGFLLSVYGYAPGTSYGYSPGLNQAISCDGLLSTVGVGKE